MSVIRKKFINRKSEQACQIELDDVSTVIVDENDRHEIEIKRYAKIEKVLLKRKINNRLIEMLKNLFQGPRWHYGRFLRFTSYA